MLRTMLEAIRGANVAEDMCSKHNRHKVIVGERFGETAYYFSIPVRRDSKREFVSSRFYDIGNGTFLLDGSNCMIKIKDSKVLFLRANETVCIKLEGECEWKMMDNELVGDTIRLLPTPNGVTVHKKTVTENTFSMSVFTSNQSWDVRKNSKYFALMREKHVPAFVISSMGVHLDDGALHPLSLTSNVIENGHRIIFRNPAESKGEMVFEINLYEHKLMQDTTVETKRPSENNAFGSVAFVGKSDEVGEQRLYLKFDPSILQDLHGRRIRDVNLYIPVLCENGLLPEAYVLQRRFCSFGSTWENRVGYTDSKLNTSVRNGLYCIHLAQTLRKYGETLQLPPGIMLKGAKENGYYALSTGDCYSAPMILEIKYGA